MFFGVPSNPMAEIMVDAIGQTVAQVPGICEAYLPQCFIEGDEEARQVLIVGVERKSQIPSVMEDLMGKMALVLPGKVFIDIIPYACADLPEAARVQECRILYRRPKPWWKMW